MKTSGRLLAGTLIAICVAGCGAQPMDSASPTFESMPEPGEGGVEETWSEEGGEPEEVSGSETPEPTETPEPAAPPEAPSRPDPSASSHGIEFGPFSLSPPTATGGPDSTSGAGSPGAPRTAPLSLPPAASNGSNATNSTPSGPISEPASPPGPSAPTSSPPAAGDGYVLEKIYYGTDREPELSSSARWSDYATALGRFQILLVLGLTLCGSAFFMPSRRYLVIIPAIVCLAGAGWFGRMTLLEAQQAELDDTNQNRRYGDRIHFVDGRHTLERGYCWVSVPTKVHTRGSGRLESPGIFEVQADPEKHFTLQRVEMTDRESFLADFRDSVHSSSQKHAFVFIHGYNVLFEEAALRTAQLKYDLDFDGPAALFSWPSRGSLLSYASDEETVNLTERSGVLHKFLEDFINETEAESIHLIAHSMGNRLLTRSFEELPDKKNSRGQKMINQLIMAAPDVNPAEFRLLADRIRDLTRGRTLYASEKDIALIGSEVLRMSNYTRLGQGGDSRVIVEGVQTIDASDLDKALFDLGHSYYVHPQVMQDLKHLLIANDSALARPWLIAVGDYWTFRQQ